MILAPAEGRLRAKRQPSCAHADCWGRAAGEGPPVSHCYLAAIAKAASFLAAERGRARMEVHMAHFQSGPFLIGLGFNWAQF